MSPLFFLFILLFSSDAIVNLRVYIQLIDTLSDNYKSSTMVLKRLYDSKRCSFEHFSIIQYSTGDYFSIKDHMCKWWQHVLAPTNPTYWWRTYKVHIDKRDVNNFFSAEWIQRAQDFEIRPLLIQVIGINKLGQVQSPWSRCITCLNNTHALSH